MHDKSKEQRSFDLKQKTKGRSKNSLYISSSAHHPSSVKLDSELLSSQYQYQREHIKAFY